MQSCDLESDRLLTDYCTGQVKVSVESVLFCIPLLWQDSTEPPPVSAVTLEAGIALRILECSVYEDVGYSDRSVFERSVFVYFPVPPTYSCIFS